MNDNEPFSDCYLNSLDLEQLDVRIIPYGWFDVSQIYNAPHVCAKPRGCAGISLIPPDEDRMRHWQQSDKGAMLQELQNLALVCQPPVTINKREQYKCKKDYKCCYLQKNSLAGFYERRCVKNARPK